MIAIKGMEMPSCCRHCPCSDDLQCNLITQYNDLKGRPNDCPLVEIVTCKDCKYYCIDEDGHGYHCEVRDNERMPTYADWYCIHGERGE